MRLVPSLNKRRRIIALTAGVVTMMGLGLAVALPAQAAVSCSVTYAASPWTEAPGVGGFTAQITLNNTGDPITSWQIRFALPSGQSLTQPGWNATYTVSGQNVTGTNMSYNGSIGTGGSTSFGFNGRWTGTYSSPTAFSVNNVACGGGGGQNQAPTVSLTSPTNGQSFAAGASIPLAATASDPDGTINRVEFLIDNAVVGTDTTSPYSFTATNVASGSHSAAARAVDNGNPAASTTSTAANFTVGQTGGQTLVANPTSLALASGGSGTVNIRLMAAPAANVAVTVTRTGSTEISCTPTSFTLTPANGTTGQNLTCSATTGTTAVTATFTAAATNTTSASFTVSRQGVVNGRVDNPYLNSGVYNNPNWRDQAAAEPGGSRVSNQPTGVWLDRIAAIAGTGGAMGLAAHLDAAVQQDAANGATPMVIQFVIYDLPGRDCAALASNGELGPNDLPRYKTEYIDQIASIMGRAAYANLRIVAIIEIDSIPNLVTNVAGRPTDKPLCDTMLQNGGYIDGVGYALFKLGAIPNVYNYIDAAHHGWIGWSDNFGATATKLAQAANASGSTPANVHGFITDTANYSALQEPFVGDINRSIGGQQIRNSTWVDFNQYNEELLFAQAFRTQLIGAGFSSGIGMLIDTSRNGWGSCVMAPCQPIQTTRPTAPSPSTDLNTFVNQSRIDRRIHKGNWCNQAGAGMGERPLQANGQARANPAPGIDAYVWIKPPGESDGASSSIPNNEGKGFDQMCAPGTPNPPNPLNGNGPTGALPNSPLSGHWFSAQFQQLMANAFPPL